MSSLGELIEAFRSNELKLPALFDALSARGPLSDDEYARERAEVERLHGDREFNPELAQALLAKLDSLRARPGTQTPATNEDMTAVRPANPRRASDEATVVAPVSRPVPQDVRVVATAGPGEAGPEDATMVLPATGGKPPSQPEPNDSDTRVRTSSSPSPAAVEADGAEADGAEADGAAADGAAPETGGTSSTGGTGSSSWKRIADAAQGEYATVGMLLKGRFLLEREIGRGGMGVVFVARDERKVEARDRDPYVAVKVLNDEFRRHPDSLIALQRESRRSQQLAHDNIVRVYDFDKDGTVVFMTMEYIDGSDLKTLIREQAYNGMPLSKARPLIEGMAWALKRAHTAGVVHSDFKPSNVMVTREGVPKVFDFGIARAGKFQGGEAIGEQTVFDAGTLGALTPAYASLEMLRGAEPTPSDDIYALGCVVFELLTGKHPFDKQSAEVAFKEGRKPPKVPGLTKRQYKALCDAVAFHSEQRLHSAIELIEGLRDVSWRERARPFLVYGVIGLAALAAGAWGVSRYMKSHHLDQVVARFSPDNRHHYYNEDQAFQALQSLGEDESKRVVVDHSNAIEQFLLGRLNSYWDPAKKHYNYAGVQHVFQVRDQLKLFSPQLDIKRSAIDQQRNALLNTLDTQLSERIAADAIFENQPDNVVSTLDTIRAIDPHSELLDNAELELKYDIAIGQSLTAGHVDEAKQRLALATRLFPDSKRLKQRSAQLLAIEHANTAAARVAVQQDVPHARTALAELIAKPELTPEWQASAVAALRVLQSDRTPATQKLLASLATAIAGEAATASTPAQIQQSSSAVTLGLQYVPASQPLLAQQARLNALQQQLQAQLQRDSVAAELDSRMESMKRAAAAHDVTKAEASLAQIRALQPDSKFLAEEGPQLLANAYLGEAESLVNHGQYQRAVDTLDQGLKTLGNRPDLRNARARDAFVVSLAQARKNPPDADGLKRLHSTLATLGKADASGLAALQSEMKVRGALQEGTFADALDALKPATATTSTTTPVAAAPEQAPVPATAPTEIASRPRAPSISAPSVAVPAPAASTAAAAVAASDPCARPDLVGKGRVCFDTIGAGRGPALVVISGVNGGKSYAMSRTDITVAEFNRFCQATHQCAGRAGEGGASLPVTDISVADAKAYAAWLTATSGYTYRLPTDAEWMHAAQADQGWKQSPDSNCIPPSADASNGPGGPISARGRQPNPWGLVNLTGNVWQWVVNGGEVMVRGGSFNSYWSDCTVAAHRSDNGNPQSDVGFRVLRELR